MTIKIAGREVDATVFDLERTLYLAEEADRIFATARIKLVEALLPEQDPQAKLRELTTLADHLGWNQAYRQLGGNIDFYHQVVRGIDRSDGLQLNPKLSQMLADLRRSQVKIGILTKATVPTAEAICTKILGDRWRDLFDAVVCDGTPGCPAEKPDPRAFEFTLEQLGVTAERTVMIGDSLPDDIFPAAALGMLTIMVGGEEKNGPWALHIARIEELSTHLTNP